MFMMSSKVDALNFIFLSEQKYKMNQIWCFKWCLPKYALWDVKFVLMQSFYVHCYWGYILIESTVIREEDESNDN